MATTAPVSRRTLHFNTLDETLADAERLVAAEREGTLTRCGNWTLGQALGHLATWANFALDGYPPEVRPPWPVRMILRLMRGRVLNHGMTSGVRIGRVPGGTLGTDVLDAEEGLRRFRSALERLRAEAPTIENPVFGRLTNAQWIQLNLRHAELHLSFHTPLAT